MTTESIRTPPGGLIDASARSYAIRLGGRFRTHSIMIVSLAVTLLVWELAALLLGLPLLFPAASTTVVALAGLAADGTLASEVSATLWRLAQGFAIGVAIGAPLGLLMGLLPPVRWFFEPYVNFFRFVTPIALLSIIITWFGSGEPSIIALIVYITTFIVLLNTMSGTMRLPVVTLRAARSLGARRLRILTSVVAPATLPAIIVGMRIALGYAFMTVIAAEIIASNIGLGHMIWTARLYLETPTLFAGLLTLALLGITIDRLFVAATRRTAGRFLHGVQ